MPYSNVTGIDLSLAVWLVFDPYDFVATDTAISATGLLKPTRQIVLTRRLSQMVAREERPEATVDLATLIASRLGHAIHDSVEGAWKDGYRHSLALLGMPEKVIQRVKVNPTPEELEEDTIAIYLERRGTRKLRGFLISGKLDLGIDGRLKDIKSTSVWTYIMGRKDEDYKLQLSIYRWIHKDIITDDEADIQFVFTDWKKSDSFGRTDYPKSRIAPAYTIPLLSERETETWISNKIDEILKYADLPEDQLPRCTDEELWRTETEWKYYSNPDNKKASKVFSSEMEAKKHLSEKGHKGVVKEVPGKVKACSYCPAFALCTQKDEYEHD